ncbi:hypothetical protein ABZT06_43955 [Streptomyces sp. NPDC005483]
MQPPLVATLRDTGLQPGPYPRLSTPENEPPMPTSFCVLGTAWRPPVKEH